MRSQRNLTEMVIVAAAMRRLLPLVYGVLKNDTPYKPNILKDRAVRL